MTFRADGTSVIRDTEAGVAGVAITFDPTMAGKIAEALNESSPDVAGREDPLTGERTGRRLNITDQRPLSEVLSDGRYVKIVGPYATATMDTPGGRQIRSLAEGSIVPGDVTAGNARHLIDVGLAAVVEADSARAAFEGAPTERHRVEMTDPTVIGPTVGTPIPGSIAAQYDEDPLAAAQRAARPAATGTTTILSGAGEAFGADPATAEPGEMPKPDASGRPRANASRDDWVAYAASSGATAEETAPVDQGGLSRDELRVKYGS